MLRRPRRRSVELPPGAYNISGPGRTGHPQSQLQMRSVVVLAATLLGSALAQPVSWNTTVQTTYGPVVGKKEVGALGGCG